MLALTISSFVLAAVMIGLACLNQRRLWWTLAAWRYRYPEVHEPSETRLTLSGIGYVVTAVLLVVIGCVLTDALPT